MAFVPIHNHSDYSLLDGASQLPAMVGRAKELGIKALALTDHGVMYGAIELLKLCKEANIKPIIGLIPALLQSFRSSIAPYMTPWSVKARAGKPSSLALCTIFGS